jgi:hypothetical protein
MVPPPGRPGLGPYRMHASAQAPGRDSERPPDKLGITSTVEGRAGLAQPEAVTRPIMMPVPLRAVLMPVARASGFGGGAWDRHWQPK